MNVHGFPASPRQSAGISPETERLLEIPHSLEKRLTGHATPESTAAVLLRCEELKSHLEATKGQLNQAAFQLEELTRILVTDKRSSFELVARPWLDELVFGQLIEDVLDAERRLAEARVVAAEIGVPLPPDLK